MKLRTPAFSDKQCFRFHSDSVCLLLTFLKKNTRHEHTKKTTKDNNIIMNFYNFFTVFTLLQILLNVYLIFVNATFDFTSKLLLMSVVLPKVWIRLFRLANIIIAKICPTAWIHFPPVRLFCFLLCFKFVSVIGLSFLFSSLL